MSFDNIPVGATLTRRYYAVRTNAYTTGTAYDTWDEAVIAAQAAFDKQVTALAASARWDADVRGLARKAVYMETRIVMAWSADADPQGLSGSVDMMAERHPDVTVLRTRASFASKLPVLPTADQVRNLTAADAAALARAMNASCNP
jgi:prophage DNA circulation protein